MKLKMDHQIGYGDHIMALLGSCKSSGSWNTMVMMEWTDAGWVGDLPGETIECKYVIVKANGNLLWEHGANRVLIAAHDFSKYYQVDSHWSATSETIHFEVIDAFNPEKVEPHGQVRTNKSMISRLLTELNLRNMEWRRQRKKYLTRGY